MVNVCVMVKIFRCYGDYDDGDDDGVLMDLGYDYDADDGDDDDCD
jgi:hypothetical protein